MKHLLMIANTFPPVGGGAVIRVTKFVKYLPHYGWNPIVVTADAILPQYDESLLKEVVHAEIVRTRSSSFHRLKGRLIKRMMRSTPAEELTIFEDRRRKRWLRTCAYALHRLHGKILDIFLIPDRQVLWVFPAFCAARRLIRKKRISVVYTISIPSSTAFVGMLLKWWYHIPWIADFRDVWTERWKYDHRLWWGRRILEAWMERMVLRYADHVITATEPARAYFINVSCPINAQKFTVITNGFDREDFKGLPSGRIHSDKRLRFTAMGVMTRTYHYDALQRLLHSLKRLEARGIIASNTYQIEFLSGVNPNVFRRGAEDLPVHYLGFFSHKEALIHCALSDVLFFILHPDFSHNSYPGKLFEYMALQRPVLGLTAPGITADFIARYKLGWVVDDRDSIALDKTVGNICTLWKKKSLPILSSAMYTQFDRRELTSELAKILDTLIL